MMYDDIYNIYIDDLKNGLMAHMHRRGPAVWHGLFSSLYRVKRVPPLKTLCPSGPTPH